MFTSDEIHTICTMFNIECVEIGELIDTSHNKNDRRYNYNINNAYFLKINNSKAIKEKYLSDINGMAFKYRDMGVYCPLLKESKEGKFSHVIEKNEMNYMCYLEEFSPYKTYKSTEYVNYDFKRSFLGHLGKLASKYSGIDLSEYKSMWSIIELNAFDLIKENPIDEKQENFNRLMKCLIENNYLALSEKLIQLNDKSRDCIKSAMDKLPSCVYQGDLNDSNILVDNDNKFVGLIDFNMFGTDVNINCFLNESMYFLEKDDFIKMSAKDIFEKMIHTQNSLLESITEHYVLKKVELDVINDYKYIIFSSFYPNICLLIKLINDHEHENKVIEFLDLIVDISNY